MAIGSHLYLYDVVVDGQRERGPPVHDEPSAVGFAPAVSCTGTRLAVRSLQQLSLVCGSTCLGVNELASRPHTGARCLRPASYSEPGSMAPSNPAHCRAHTAPPAHLFLDVANPDDICHVPLSLSRSVHLGHSVTASELASACSGIGMGWTGTRGRT
jgi:hypothetical protein